jgi:hypothetical protein
MIMHDCVTLGMRASRSLLCQGAFRSGVLRFTWATTGVDQPGGCRDRTWIDFNTSPGLAEDLLKQRIYHVNQPN